MPLVPNADLLTILGAVRTAMLTNPKVHLYTAVSPPLSPATALGDFTEATYNGYAAQVSAFGAPYINASGQAVCDSPLLQFQATDGLVPETIVGFYVTNNAGSALLWAGALATPFPMLDATSALPLVLQFVMQPPGPPY